MCYLTLLFPPYVNVCEVSVRNCNVNSHENERKHILFQTHCVQTLGCVHRVCPSLYCTYTQCKFITLMTHIQYFLWAFYQMDIQNLLGQFRKDSNWLDRFYPRNLTEGRPHHDVSPATPSSGVPSWRSLRESPSKQLIGKENSAIFLKGSNSGSMGFSLHLCFHSAVAEEAEPAEL